MTTLIGALALFAALLVLAALLAYAVIDRDADMAAVQNVRPHREGRGGWDS